MMQRIGIFLLAILYLFSTAGTVVNTQYCMGRIASVSVGGFDTKASPCMTQSACCKTEWKVVKLSDVHQPGPSREKITLTPVIIRHPLSLLQLPVYNGSVGAICVTHAPPPKVYPSLFLQNCTFRI